MVFITVPNTARGSLYIRVLSAGKRAWPPVRRKQRTSGDFRKRQDSMSSCRFVPNYVEAKEKASRLNFKPVNVNIIQNDGDKQHSLWLTDIKMTGGFM